MLQWGSSLTMTRHHQGSAPPQESRSFGASFLLRPPLSRCSAGRQDQWILARYQILASFENFLVSFENLVIPGLSTNGLSDYNPQNPRATPTKPRSRDAQGRSQAYKYYHHGVGRPGLQQLCVGM